MKARDLQLGVLYAYAPRSNASMLDTWGVDPALVVDLRPVARPARGYRNRGAGTHVQVALQYMPAPEARLWDPDQQQYRSIATEAEAEQVAAELNALARRGQRWVAESYVRSGVRGLWWRAAPTQPEWTPRTVPLAHLRWLWADVAAARAEWEADQDRMRIEREAQQARERAARQQQARERAARQQHDQLARSVATLVRATHQQRADHLARILGAPPAEVRRTIHGDDTSWEYLLAFTPAQAAAAATGARCSQCVAGTLWGPWEQTGWMRCGLCIARAREHHPEPPGHPCQACGRTDLPLHVDYRCAECSPHSAEAPMV